MVAKSLVDRVGDHVVIDIQFQLEKFKSHFQIKQKWEIL